MPRNSASPSEMLSGLKSRLGFASDDHDDFSRYEADFNDYDDFDDDGFSPDYDDEYAGYGADYDEHAPVGAYRPVTTKRTSKFGRGDSTPDLVSIDDVKAHTKVTEPRSGESTRSTSSRRTSNRSLIEPSGPAPSSPAYTASLRESASRSEGLNSLFESSGSSDLSPSTSGQLSSGASTAVRGVPTHVTQRALTVIKPMSYNDVERVAKSLKSGDVVVLGMRNTPAELAKRVLDFSFGVASALDANVECPGDRVYAIARGNALTEEEKTRLRNQGAL